MTRRLIPILILILLTSPGLVVAQDHVWTCDSGPNDVLNAAQAADDEGDQDTAWALAAYAEAICTDNPDRFAQAQALRRRTGLLRRLNIAKTAEPGLVVVGDYHLFMACTGEGSPTVIFEADNAFGFGYWEDVEPAVSMFTHTCRYERLGVGLSDSVPEDTVRTAQDQVNDLVSLLELTDIDPPYILVGSLLGSHPSLLFAYQYPDLVEGLVLVNPWPPDLERTEERVERYMNIAYDSVVLIERLDVASSFLQVSDAKDFGDMPLAVVSASILGFPDWSELQEGFASYSTNSRHIIIEGASMDMPRTTPERVIEAILWTLDQVRTVE